MVSRSYRAIVQKIEGYSRIIVFGAGGYGKDLVDTLLRNGIKPFCFFDNSKELRGKCINGIEICEPFYDGNKDTLYIVSIRGKYRKEICTQLEEIGVPQNQIIEYAANRDYEYMITVPLEEYRAEISDMFREKHGYDMNWDNPRTYSEIINWEKLYLKDEKRSIYADKYRARDIVKDIIGNDYLTHVYGVWEKAEDIPYESLPKRFALKVNNGSDRNIIFIDKEQLDKRKVNEQNSEWFSRSFALVSLEMHYDAISPLVYAEEYLDFKSGQYTDYKCYCFHGKVGYIHRIRNEHQENAVARFYDKDWRPQSFNHGYKNDEEIIDAPTWLDTIIDLSEKLSKNLRHARVDWFVSNEGKVYFAEITLSSWSGLEPFTPHEADEMFGRLILNE